MKDTIQRFWPVIVPMAAALSQLALFPSVMMMALAHGERNITNPPIWIVTALSAAWCLIPLCCIQGFLSAWRRSQAGDRLVAILGFAINLVYAGVVIIVYFLLFVGPHFFGTI